MFLGVGSRDCDGLLEAVVLCILSFFLVYIGKYFLSNVWTMSRSSLGS